MYISPHTPLNKSKFFISTNNSEPDLSPQEGIKEIKRLLDSGLGRIYPCTDEYKGYVVLHNTLPKSGETPYYLAFLGPEKAFRQLALDSREKKEVSVGLLTDVLHLTPTLATSL